MNDIVFYPLCCVLLGDHALHVRFLCLSTGGKQPMTFFSLN